MRRIIINERIARDTRKARQIPCLWTHISFYLTFRIYSNVSL